MVEASDVRADGRGEHHALKRTVAAARARVTGAEPGRAAGTAVLAPYSRSAAKPHAPVPGSEGRSRTHQPRGTGSDPPRACGRAPHRGYSRRRPRLRARPRPVKVGAQPAVSAWERVQPGSAEAQRSSGPASALESRSETQYIEDSPLDAHEAARVRTPTALRRAQPTPIAGRGHSPRKRLSHQV